MKFATVRLGKTSVKDIRTLASMPQGVVADTMTIDVLCTQVPDDLSEGTIVFVWLGSDNSKGAPTEWVQGFKVVGLVSGIKRGARYNDESTTTLSLKYVFKESVTRLDVLRDCPEAYYWCSSLPIIGLDDHSNQTIRCFATDSERGEIGAFLYALNAVDSGFRKEITAIIPELDALFWNNVRSPKTGEKIATWSNRSDEHTSYQLIIYGAPGTGKSWRIKNDTKGCKVIRTTFHPDSDYSTFVGAYKPSMEDDDFKTVVMTGEIGSAGNITKKDGLVTKKRIVYAFRAQAFLEAYVAAWRKCAAYLAATDEDSSKKATQFLVIEEINRGNCAQIFGDIFQLLDREDDGYSSYAIDADSDLKKFVADSFKGDTAKGIPALDLAGVDLGDRDITPNEISSGDKLLLPPNLYIWATMNTSDQSLFPIDSAFKRRWAWRYIPISNAGKNYSIEVGRDKYDWWTFLEKANDLVQSFTESEDKKLGYFFCKADRNGVISLEQFVGKVVFYLWNGVFKDTGFDDEVFDDGKGGKLYFKRFFDAKGDPNPESVRQFMKNLGVGAVASSAGNAEGADEGAVTEPPAGDAENTEGQGQ